jgi:hypothetical protein
MDPLLLISILVVVVGLGVAYFGGYLDFNKDGKVDEKDLDILKDSAEAAIEKKVDEVKKEVKEKIAEVKAKLPTAAKLKALTKAQLEDLGREFGIELDKRKTKDKMIADLKSEHKKLK